MSGNGLARTCPEFFTTRNRNRGFAEAGLKRLVGRTWDAAGIHSGAHRLRHALAISAFEDRCDIFSLAKMLSHQDIRTTMIYLAANIEHLRAQILHLLNENTVW